ncbi:MAG TPA: TetR/AcrR family transcriptional regulator, partial [Novosphingobium sp.]|nr:TetR/AcrR family transcriptional regulator [Novosphingobium sp.]
IAEQEPLSLSAVARRVPLGMTSLYNYFSDLTELFLAVLDPVMATAEEAYVGQLRSRWPDEDLAERCHAYARGKFEFWSRHSRLLHLRNAMADSGDIRVRTYRVKGSQELIRLMIAQMDGDPADRSGPAAGMATVLITAIERTATVATDAGLTTLFGPNAGFPADHYLKPGARIMEMAIRDMRARIAAGQG